MVIAQDLGTCLRTNTVDEMKLETSSNLHQQTPIDSRYNLLHIIQAKVRLNKFNAIIKLDRLV